MTLNRVNFNINIEILTQDIEYGCQVIHCRIAFG